MDDQRTIDQPPMTDIPPSDTIARDPDTTPIDNPDDPVEEQSDESFPASDPPSFTGSTTD